MKYLVHSRPFAYLLERLLFGLALVFLGVWSWARLDAITYGLRQNWRLTEILGGHSADSAMRPFGIASATRRESRASGLIGRIEIPRLHASAVVAEGADPRTLRRTVGHLPETAYPGEPGNAVFAGHRDSFFSHLQEVRVGDRLLITTPDGVFEYRVESKRVVRPEQTEVLLATSARTLTMITCYPFHYLGPAPQRLVVRALQVTRSPVTS